MTHTQTVLDLLSACREDDSDTLRLALADAIQEDGDDARAELIRVQVELQKGCDMWTFRSGFFKPQCCGLHAREFQLRRDNPHWLAKPCLECGEWRYGGKIPIDHNLRNSLLIYCPTCGGTRDLFTQRQWNPDYQEYQPGTDCIACLDRGLVRVTAPPERLWIDHPMHGGFDSETVPHPWLTAIARDPFVVYVDVEGNQPSPEHRTGRGTVWYWCRDREVEMTRHWPEGHPGKPIVNSGLPEPIHRLCGEKYHTEADANHALSVALLKWAKGEAS